MGAVKDRDGGGILPRSSWLLDLVVAVVIVSVFWVQPLAMSAGHRSLTVGIVLAVLVAVAVTARWWFPNVAPIVALAATGAGWLLNVSTDPMLAVAWCLYPLALRRGRGSRVIGVIAILVTFLGLMHGNAGSSVRLDERIVIAIAAVAAVWLLGQVEARRLDAVREAVEQRAVLEQEQRQTAMAREVHDVVGHALTVISAEADIARNIPGTTEAELRESLEDIEQRSRAALVEVQTLVRAMRDGAALTNAVSVPELVTAARLSGLKVDAQFDAPDLPPSAEAVVSRVVQEALSNTVRHADATNCTVNISADGEAVTVCVDDDGTGLPARHRHGSGLAGMRERVEDAGGSLTVTNLLEGGTRVLATLPLETSMR